MFVNVTLKGISDNDSIEPALATSEPLQRLVQQHNRIAFTIDHIDVITKDFTGAQLKSELEKHSPEVLIGLLNEYISVTKIIVNDKVEPNVVQVEVIDKNQEDAGLTLTNKHYTPYDNDGLRANDKKDIKVYLIKTMINIGAASVLLLLGAALYIAWAAKEMPDNEFINILLKGTTEIVKFIFMASK